MQPIDRFIAALEARDCRPRRGTARCPAHEDSSPSLTFREGTDGRVLFDCKTGCNHDAIVNALGLEWKDLFPDKDEPARSAPSQPARAKLPTEDDLAIYQEDLHGDEVLMRALHKLRGWTPDALKKLGVGVASPETVTELTKRREGLRRLVLPVRDKDGTLINVVLYAPNPDTRGNHPKVLALAGHPRDLFPPPENFPVDEPLFVLEGEPDGISGATIHVNATSIPGVSGWKPEWTERLKKYDAILTLDCDSQGRTRATEASSVLLKAGGTIRTLDLDPTRADGYDLGDFTKNATTDILRSGARKLLLDLAEGIRRKEPFKLRPVSGRDFVARVPKANPDDDFLGPFFRRGHRVAIGGHTGHGKTTFILQAIAAAAYGDQFLKWRGRGQVKCLVVDLEQGERSLAKRLRETRIAERNGYVQIVNIPEGLELDRKLEQRVAVEETLATGNWDIVLLDPAYQLVAEEPTEDAQAQALVRMLDGWRSRFGFCLVIPMHCRKAAQQGHGLTIHDIHGRGMMLRNAEVVMGIERVKKGEAKLHWWKDRDGDLDVPLSSYWKMKFDRSNLFQWAPELNEEEAA